MMSSLLDVQPVAVMKAVKPFDMPLPKQTDPTHVKEVAQDFESLFIHQLLKEFDQTVHHEDSLLYAGHAEDVFRSMYNQELARVMAKAGGIGFADMIEKDVLAREESQREVLKGEE